MLRVSGGQRAAESRLAHVLHRDNKTLCSIWDQHHGDGRLAMWCPAPAGVQAELVDREPERFFVPEYVGHRGWIGVRLDVDPDWDEIDAILRDAYRCVGPKTLVKLLESPQSDE